MEKKNFRRDFGRCFTTISPNCNHSRTNLLTYKMSWRLMQPWYIACWKYIQTEQNVQDSNAPQPSTEYTGWCVSVYSSITKPMDQLAWSLRYITHTHNNNCNMHASFSVSSQWKAHETSVYSKFIARPVQFIIRRRQETVNLNVAG